MDIYVLIIIFMAWDVGGTTTQEFNSLESCEKAKEWSEQHWREDSGPRVKASCFIK